MRDADDGDIALLTSDNWELFSKLPTALRLLHIGHSDRIITAMFSGMVVVADVIGLSKVVMPMPPRPWAVLQRARQVESHALDLRGGPG